MRVLHVHSGNMYGGVETLLATLVREGAAAPGMTSEVALCFPGRLADELKAMERPAFMLEPVRLSRPFSLLKARQSLRRLLREQSFDAVVCHQPWSCVAFGPVVRAAGFPVVLWVHMAVEGGALLDRLARRVCPDLAVCNSEFTRTRVRGWLPNVQTEVVYGPVSLAAVPPGAPTREEMRASLGTPLNDAVVVMASRLDAMKGHRVLIGRSNACGSCPAGPAGSWAARRAPTRRSTSTSCSVPCTCSISTVASASWGSAATCPPSCGRPTCTASPTPRRMRSACRSSKRCTRGSPW
jgi:hypothetical protein